MIIEEYRAQSNTQALMQGFGVSAGFKNVSNQVIMMGSYDLIGKVVEDRFKELIPDANVKVSIMNKRFTVIGEAGTGIYSIPRDRFTIYQALSMSGNLNLSADFKRVRILRETVSGETKVLEFDIRPESIINSEYYYIYPNDIIYVQRDKSSFYKVNNWSGFIES